MNGGPTGDAWRRLRGILLMTAGCGFFTINDAAMKLLVSDGPVSQEIFLRCAVVLAVLALLQPRRLFDGIGRQAPWKPQLLCAILWGTSVTCFVVSIAYLPLAIAVTAIYTGPLFVALLAPFLLAEHLGPRRIVIIIVGFLGTLLVVSPAGENFSFYIVLPIIGAMLSAWRDIELRRLTLRATTQSILIVTQIVIAVFFAMPTALVWQPLGIGDLILLAIAASGFATGIYLSVEALRDNEASLVVPYKYSGVLWSLIAGVVVWQDIPTAYQMIGVVLVVCSGIYLSVGNDA